MQSIRTLESRIDTVVETIMKRVHGARENGNTVDLCHLFSALAPDIVNEYALGEDLSMDFMNNPDC